MLIGRSSIWVSNGYHVVPDEVMVSGRASFLHYVRLRRALEYLASEKSHVCEDGFCEWQSLFSDMHHSQGSNCCHIKGSMQRSHKTTW
jgi:predicted nucleic acid-binding Zn finger protein